MVLKVLWPCRLHYQLLVGIDHIYFVVLLTLHYAARRSAHFTEKILKPYVDRGTPILKLTPSFWGLFYVCVPATSFFFLPKSSAGNCFLLVFLEQIYE